MISVEEAHNFIFNRIPVLESESVALEQAAGRICSGPVVAPLNTPLFDNSAMDGYAIHFDDSDKPLPVLGESKAGDPPGRTLPRGSAMRIFTGAPVPVGADTVVMQENATRIEHMVSLENVIRGRHIRACGEDISQGQTLLESGRRITPRDITVLASQGIANVQVSRQPRVAVLSSGDELIPPGSPLGPGKLFDSNTIGLSEFIKEAGAIPVPLPPAQDTEDDVKDKLQRAFACDAVVTCGGVSVGDYDLIKPTWEALGAETIFWKVAIKPGKPVAFASFQSTPIFALPGNPVSAFTAFEVFVRPALLKMMGAEECFRPRLQATLQSPFQKKGDRRHYLRGYQKYKNGELFVQLASQQGSGILSSLLNCNALVEISEDISALHPGDSVTIHELR